MATTVDAHTPPGQDTGAGTGALPAGAGSGRRARSALTRGSTAWKVLRTQGILLALFIIIVVGNYLSPNFLKEGNIQNVARQGSFVGILAIGMTFVILTAGIDLSVGSILGAVAIGFAAMMSAGVVWPVAILLALLMGAAIGALNGLGIVKGGLQPFIMTLGMLVIARGATMSFADGRPIRVGPSAPDIAWIGNGMIGPIPLPVVIFGGIAFAAWFTLRYTSFGRQVYAVGDNPEAARLSGIPTKRVIFSAYVISGLCAAVVALMTVSRLAAAEPTAGEGNELDAIAIVVIGGTSLFGGEGGIGGTVIGAVIVQAMNNLLNLLGVTTFAQPIVKGLIILGAVLLERRTRGSEEGR